MGLSDRESAALMGVHSLGRCRLENSGFDGWWSDPKNAATFNNNYYISLLLKGWAPVKTKKGKMQWGRVGARTLFHPELMLNTDICLAYGDHAEFAEKQNCCAWIMPEALPGGAAEKLMNIQQAQEGGKSAKWCGFKFSPKEVANASFDKVKRWCCEDGPLAGPEEDCGSPSKLQGFAAKHIVEFALDEPAWIAAFSKVWNKATQLNVGSALGAEPAWKAAFSKFWNRDT